MIIFYHIQIHGHTKLHCYNIDKLKLKGKAIFLVRLTARKGMQGKGFFFNSQKIKEYFKPGKLGCLQEKSHKLQYENTLHE